MMVRQQANSQQKFHCSEFHFKLMEFFTCEWSVLRNCYDACWRVGDDTNFRVKFIINYKMLQKLMHLNNGFNQIVQGVVNIIKQFRMYLRMHSYDGILFNFHIWITVDNNIFLNSSYKFQMSRSKGNGNGNVFKLSGNLALGANQYGNDYTNVNRQYGQQDSSSLSYQKSYNQVTNKQNQYNDIKYGNSNNYEGSYSNQGRRNQNNNPSSKQYQYKPSTIQGNGRSQGLQNIYSDPYNNSQNRISNNNINNNAQKYNQYPPSQQKYDYNQIGQNANRLPQKKSSIRQNNNNRKPQYEYQNQYTQGAKSKSNINSYNKISQQPRPYEYQQKIKPQPKVPTYGSRDTQLYSQTNVGNVQKKTNPSTNKKNLNRDKYNQPQQASQYQNHKSDNQRRLKEKENVQIKQYDPSTFVQCRAGCGRKFNPDSVSKHQKVCKKVFQKKRKEFNVQEQRIVSKDQVKLMKQGAIIQKKMQQKKANQKLPKWKAQSLAFRAILKSNVPGGKMTKQQRQILDQSTKVGHIQCKFCGRSFNQQAAIRHIKFCQQQQKKNAMKKRR